MVVLWLSLVILIPLAAVVEKAFGGGFSAFITAVTSPETAAALRLTIGLSAAVALINVLAIERDVEEAAASLGAGAVATFRRVILPQILPAIISGTVLSFARALGEYGSLVLISSNLPFQTEIASSVIYGKLQDADNAARSTQQAAAIATILLAASAVVLIVADIIQRRELRRG
jgi:sulfate transport system permease protein